VSGVRHHFSICPAREINPPIKGGTDIQIYKPNRGTLNNRKTGCQERHKGKQFAYAGNPRERALIARLNLRPRGLTPVTQISELKSESDVEQKLLYPFICHPRTGFPLAIFEAKSPDESIESGIREARLYATEINKRYPPNINPILFILASNGTQFALTQWDSETEIIFAKAADLQPGSAILAAFRSALDKGELEKRAEHLSRQFQGTTFHRIPSLLGASRVSEQMGMNAFAQELIPVITKYFGTEADEATDDIIDRGYVSSSERGEYDAVLETYLKDRVRLASDSQFETIVTTRNSASGLSTQVGLFAQNPKYYGRVQLVVGKVGAGKSLFIRRFYRKLLPKAASDRTLWGFLNFNVVPPGTFDRPGIPSERFALREWIVDEFLKSFQEVNGLNVTDLEIIEKIFAPEMRQFERGPAKILFKADPTEYNRERFRKLQELTADRAKYLEGVARHFTGERRQGLVCVFDNADKRSRDEQLQIFAAAQWFKDLTRALVIVNLRDTTFEAHREEPPLDAFSNAVNFYIKAPRFGIVIKRRLELVLENVREEGELATSQRYALESGATVLYPVTKLGEFLMSIYLSLFNRATIGGALEALVAKDVRRALGMFADIIASPHIPTRDITRAALHSGPTRFSEDNILRALMRGRYRIFNDRGIYIRNILDVFHGAKRPSNFLYADILEFLIRNRKKKIDFSVEGYALASTVVNKMEELGYDDEDAFGALTQLVRWGLVEPESLLIDELQPSDAVQVHGSGFIHERYLLRQLEYVVGVTADMSVSSRELAGEIQNFWGNAAAHGEPGYMARKRLVERLSSHLTHEYERRMRRHAFYGDLGFGGWEVVTAVQSIADRLNKRPYRPHRS
jgi:hypothetical protein